MPKLRSLFQLALTRFKTSVGTGSSASIKGRLYNCEVVVEGVGAGLIVDSGCRIWHSKIRVIGDGATVYIGSHVSMRSSTVLAEHDKSTVRIGFSTSLREASVVASGGSKIVIEKDCRIGGAKIRSGDHHKIVDKFNMHVNPANDIWIGEHVWLCEDSLVLKGCVNVAPGVILGARSVATRSLDYANAVYVGTPAKLVKHDVRWIR